MARPNDIRRLREAKPLTQAALAEACRLSVRTVKRAEAGEASSPETLAALCAVLGCGVEDLYPPPPPVAVTSPADLHGPVLAGCLLAMASSVAEFGVVARIGPHPARDGDSLVLSLVILGSVLATLLFPAVALGRRALARMGRVVPPPGPYATALMAGLLGPSAGGEVAFALKAGRPPCVALFLMATLPCAYVVGAVVATRVRGPALVDLAERAGPAAVAWVAIVQLMALADGSLPSAGPYLMAALPALLGPSRRLPPRVATPLLVSFALACSLVGSLGEPFDVVTLPTLDAVVLAALLIGRPVGPQASSA